MLRRAGLALGPELLLAVALAWAVTASAPDGQLLVGLLTGLASALLIMIDAASGLLAGQRRLLAFGLPGFAAPRSIPLPRRSRLGVGAVIVLAVAMTTLGLGWVGLVLAVVADLVAAAWALDRFRSWRRRAVDRTRFAAALTDYAPQFVVYTARRNDASYQLRMWLPQLEKLGVPYLVVVRHPSSVGYVRTVTSAPVVCAPTGPDLDAVMVPSLRAAFYVNGVAENAGFVGYRQLRHVYLGHGDSDKELSVHPMHAMFDLVFVAGQAAIERYGPAGVQIPAEKFRIVGRPQLAGLSGPSSGRTGSAGVRVLYAPTWRGYNARTTLSSLPVATGLVQALLRAGAVITFRAHPFSWQGAERADIEAVDSLLRADRERTGAVHRLAGETRAADAVSLFDDSDALLTDVGSVLVDYFATEKPYAVVLPAGVSAELARMQYPSLTAAYLVPRDSGDRDGGFDGGVDRGVDGGVDEPGRDWTADLLSDDPLARQRASTTRYYLGDRPRDDAPFLDAVRQLLLSPPGR